MVVMVVMSKLESFLGPSAAVRSYANMLRNAQFKCSSTHKTSLSRLLSHLSISQTSAETVHHG